MALPTKNFLFTWNNYPDEWAHALEECPFLANYMGAKQMFMPMGIPHISGYLLFKDYESVASAEWKLDILGISLHVQPAHGKIMGIEYVLRPKLKRSNCEISKWQAYMDETQKKDEEDKENAEKTKE